MAGKTLRELGLTARGGANPLLSGLTVDSRAVASLATVEKLAGSLGMPPSALVERGETLVRARGARLAAIAG